MKKKTFFGIYFILTCFVTGAWSQDIKVSAPISYDGSGMEDAVINVAKTAGQSVVSISTEHTTKIKRGKRYYFGSPFGGSSPFGEEDQFKSFFDDFFGQFPDTEFKQRGLGSGVIIDPQGYILTNEHVISEADKISVTLSDGRTFKGEIKGRDRRSDLAIIKINATSLPSLSLGDSDNLKIGQWVVAIGNPFGFAMQNPEPTVTVGVISALHRTLGRMLSGDRDYNDLIQTDAAINPGNSGGPMVNLRGEIVGINVAIFSTSGGYQGVGFAIPINNAKRIVAQLKEGKKISYGWLGVTVQDLTDELAKYFGLTDKSGVLIAKVSDNSPAQKANMLSGDVIKEVDNKTIKNVKDLLNIVAKLEVGHKVRIVLVRDKKNLPLEVEIGQRPENLEEEPQEAAGESTKNWRGLEVEAINSENSRRFRLEGKEGVVIVNILPDSPAAETDLTPGEAIVEINKQPVKNIADYEKATKDLKGDALIRTTRGYFLIKNSE